MTEPVSATGKRSWLRSSATLSPRARTSTTSNGAPTSTATSTIARKIGGLGRRALIDTSVAVHLKESEFKRLLPELATSTLTIAELVRGLHTQVGDLEIRRRRNQLQRIETHIELLPFDSLCAHAYGAVATAVERLGRKPRGSRALDLMIATTALAHEIPLYTLNVKDLRGLEDLIEIVDVAA